MTPSTTAMYVPKGTAAVAPTLRVNGAWLFGVQARAGGGSQYGGAGLRVTVKPGVLAWPTAGATLVTILTQAIPPQVKVLKSLMFIVANAPLDPPETIWAL